MNDEQKRYAVIIGVSAYDDDIAELRFARADALRLQQVLLESCGFAPNRVYVLTNGSEPALDPEPKAPTRPNILEKVQYVCDAADPEDLVLIYFAGHGVEISKSPYLITSDTRMEVLKKTAVDVRELNGMLEAAKSRCVLRIFDACRSPFSYARGTVGRMTVGLQQAVMQSATGWASFSSCSSGEVARESGDFNQGVFTHYLCEGLSGKAANDDGDVTFERLVDYVKTSVQNWCERQTLRQTPHSQSDLSGTLVLATSLRPTPMAQTAMDSPFSTLLAGIEEQLANTAEDARRLTLTSDEEWREVMGLARERLEARLGELQHPALVVRISEAKPLSSLEGSVSKRLRGEVDANGLHREFTKRTLAYKVDFSSAEIVLPRTSLFVTLVRFEFFYWIWYCHVCHTSQLQGTFSPKPASTTGFFTFKPTAAKNGEKMERTLTEVLSRASDDIVAWAKQLGEYVESRLKPLREVGDIIE